MSEPTLLVGCPVWKRAWALERWFPAVEEAAFVAGLVPEYIFAIDPRDEPSNTVIAAWCAGFERRMHPVWIEENPHEDERIWNFDRYERMTYLRNLILRRVRGIRPMFYLSVDSDIFLANAALKTMLDLAGVQFDAVGGKTYMTPDGTHTPSFGFLTGGGIDRYESTEVFPTQVIMAIKLMTKKAYHVDYEPHVLGEDIGWSLACARQGVTLGWDGRVASKHAMSPEAADAVDVRCGF